MAGAQAAGGTIEMPAADQHWGDRMGKIRCPAGHRWMLALRRAVLTPQEIGERAAKMFGQPCA